MIDPSTSRCAIDTIVLGDHETAASVRLGAGIELAGD
jgi:hypothetical protein